MIGERTGQNTGLRTGSSGGRYIPPSGDFQLAATNYTPTKVTMEIIAPRPDVERTTNSRYSYAYPGLEFEVPISVVGGAYPFKYEIIARSGTANVATATIGETRTYQTDRTWYGTQNQKNYGTLRWTPLAGDDTNTYSFTVRVTGQDGVSVTVTFTGTVDSTKFVFIQDGAVGGDGTKDLPFEDTDDVWGPDSAFNTYAGKFVYLRAGNYAAMPTTQWTANKPYVWMRYPGDARPVLAPPSGSNYTFSGAAAVADFWWSGIYFNGTAGTSVTQCRYFGPFTSLIGNRWTFWDNYFFNGQPGTNGGDNNGWVIFGNSGVTNQYLVMSGNVFDTASYSTNGFYCYDAYQLERHVFEHNVVKNWSGDAHAQPKQDTRLFSIRANDMWEGNSTARGLHVLGGYDQFVSGDFEICWNYIKDTTSPIRFGFGVGPNITHGPMHFYKNTILTTDPCCFYLNMKNMPNETINSINNILVSGINPHRVYDDLPGVQAFITSNNGCTDAAFEAYTAGATCNNTWYDEDTQTEVNLTTGLLQNGGLTRRGLDGAEIY